MLADLLIFAYAVIKIGIRGGCMKDAHDLFEYGQRLFMKGKYKESIEEFTKALD